MNMTTRILAGCLLVTACGGQLQTRDATPADSAQWVNAALASLTLEQKVGQLLMGRLEGDFENIGAPEMRRVQHEIRKYHVGGYAIGIGGPADIALKTNTLQGFAQIPLLIAADLEWGSGMRLWRPTYLPYGIEGGGGTAFPFNMGIGATGDVAWADTAGRITGAEARAVGINWVFAPVVDINTDAANPIVNVRAYGSDAAAVGRYGAAFVRGATRARVLTSAKHFPGHGDTNLDSHVDLPVLSVSRARLDSLELAPFRASVQSGVSSIMLGHLAIPAVIGDSITPASISPVIGQEIVRGQLRFGGIIVTDALTMGALRKVPGYTPAEVAVRAVLAGSDVVLGPPSIELAHAGLVAAVKSGRITEARIDSSVARILGAKAWLGLHRNRTVPLEGVTQIVASPAHEAAASIIAQRSITLARDQGVLPLDPRRTRSVAMIAFSAPNDVTAGRTLGSQLRVIYGPQVTTARLDENASGDAIERAIAEAAAADAVVFATFLMPISGQGHIQVPARAADIAARIAQLGKPTVVVSFGDPYGPAALPLARTYLVAWQPRGLHAQIAVARAIAGVAPITGRLPIDLPGGLTRGSGLERGVLSSELSFANPAAVGMDPAVLPRVDSLIDAAISSRATPGAAVAIGRNSRIVKLQGYGRLDYRPGFGNVTDSTIYDLASLTKVVGTTTAAMLMIDDGRLELDAPLSRYLPELLHHADKRNITVRNALLHNAGFRSFAPLYRTVQDRQQALEAIAALPLEYPTGTRTTYSDFGFIMLGFAIERVSGKTLDELLGQRVFRPLGMRDTYYNPPLTLVERIAPTELDTIYRKLHVHGRVHDENASAIGGVSGHAGLFSSARDLAKFAQLLLNGGYYNGHRIISPETIALFTKRQGESSSRALGWDTPSPNSSAGDLFPAASFGHTGFTGTSIWLDTEHELFVILLTNRVNPTRENQKHVPLRRALADAVQNSIRGR